MGVNVALRAPVWEFFRRSLSATPWPKTFPSPPTATLKAWPGIVPLVPKSVRSTKWETLTTIAPPRSREATFHTTCGTVRPLEQTRNEVSPGYRPAPARPAVPVGGVHHGPF